MLQMVCIQATSENRCALQFLDRRGQLQLEICVSYHVLEGRARHDSSKEVIDLCEERAGGEAALQAAVAGLGQRSLLIG